MAGATAAAASSSGASAPASPELIIGVEKVEEARSGGLRREEIGGKGCTQMKLSVFWWLQLLYRHIVLDQ